MNSKSWTCVLEGEVNILDLKTNGTLLLKEGLGLSADSSHGMSSPAVLEWTKGLNWSFDSKSDSLNKVGIDEINRNYLNTDYE